MSDIMTPMNSMKKYPIISLEVFPPKSENAELELIKELETLKRFEPEAVSVTYGAGGSNKDSSIGLIKKLQSELGFNVMPHFTCICSSKEYIDNYLKEILDLNIRDILALRGDEPQDIEVCYKDFVHANELVEYLKSKSDLNISVAGYPEGHYAAENLQKDLENLKRKVDSGANSVYTQMFFENHHFFEFLERTKQIGIDVPIIPGILPIVSIAGLLKMSELCKVEVPKGLMKKLETYQDDPKSILEIGVDFATEQVESLINSKVKNLHFYTLNKAYSIQKILNGVKFYQSL